MQKGHRDRRAQRYQHFKAKAMDPDLASIVLGFLIVASILCTAAALCIGLWPHKKTRWPGFREQQDSPAEQHPGENRSTRGRS